MVRLASWIIIDLFIDRVDLFFCYSVAMIKKKFILYIDVYI